MKTLTRKDFLKVSGAGLGAAGMMMLTGCGTSSDSSSTSESSSETTSSSSEESSSTESSAEASSDTALDTSENVELKMYLIGDRADDFDEVYDAINEILLEELNCTVSVDFLSWSEHDTKYSLLFSSGEDFDLIFTASSWCHYETTVALGGYYGLSEEFIQTYAPDIWDVLPEEAWEEAKIDGTIYMVPNYQNSFGADVMAVRGDIMEELGMDSISTWDELYEFYAGCAELGIYASQGGPWYIYFQSQGLSTTSGTPNSGAMILYNTQDASDLDFYYILEWDGFTDYCKQMKELADMGAWSPDVLSSTDDRQTGLLTGRTASMTWNLGTCRTYAKQANEENPDWNVTLVDPTSTQAKQTGSYIGNGVAINVNSNNKERAMMALNKFYTNQEIYDLSMLGIEGKHWEAVGDDQYTLLDQSGYPCDNNCNWGWTNDTIKRTEYIENRTELDDQYDEILASWVSNIKAAHPYDNFTFDTSNVTTQVAAVEAAMGTYYDPLINGLVDDVDATIDAFRSAMESAGIQDIIDELKSQIAEYVA